MKGKNIVLALFLFVFSFLIFSSVSAQVPQWASSVVSAPSSSGFHSVAVDSSGDLYATGRIYGAGIYNLGNGVTVSGSYLNSNNAVLVKYGSNGNTKWARSVVVGSGGSRFYSVAVDLSGNVYAVGYMLGTGVYSFGNGVTVAGTVLGSNFVLVKYNSSGNVQWARSVIAGSSSSEASCIDVGLNGDVYAAGWIRGTATYNFGDGVTVSGAYSGDNVVLVKYDSDGNAQWVKSVVAGSNWSRLYSAAVYSSGYVHIVGVIRGTATYNFGDGVAVSGAYSGDNVVLAKYYGSGSVQWAKSVIAGESHSGFKSVALDSDGNVYAAGYIFGDKSYDFGNRITVAGTCSGFCANVVLVKYYAGGNVQWAKSVVAGSDFSRFYSVAVDLSGNVYAAGNLVGTGVYDFGNGVTVVGAYSGHSSMAVKYNSGGNVQWAKSVVSGLDYSMFESVAVDLNENLYVAGYIFGDGSYDFGNGVVVSGAYSGGNVVIVKYLNDTVCPLLSPSISPSLSVTFAPTPTTTVSYPLSVTDVYKSGNKNNVILFTASDFASRFIGGYLVKVKVVSLPNIGILKLYGVEVNLNQEINVSDLDNLAYVPGDNRLGRDSFMWAGSDRTMYATDSANVNIYIDTVADVDTIERVEAIVGIVSGVVILLCSSIAGVRWCCRHSRGSLYMDME